MPNILIRIVRLAYPMKFCVSLVTPAGIGRNVFGDKWYGYHLSQIEYGVQLLWVGSIGANSWERCASRFD